MIAKRKTKRVKAGGNSFCYQIMILAIRLWNNYTMIGQNDLPLFDYMGRRWKTIALLVIIPLGASHTATRGVGGSCKPV